MRASTRRRVSKKEMEAIAENLRSYRIANGLTQADLADQISKAIGRKLPARCTERWEQAKAMPSGKIIIGMVRLGIITPEAA